LVLDLALVPIAVSLRVIAHGVLQRAGCGFSGGLVASYVPGCWDMMLVVGYRMREFTVGFDEIWMGIREIMV
jgi:hypothetical protein